jgi:hypothetical protein
MNLTRTTLRLNTDLKRAAEKRALEEDTTLQAVLNEALEQYLGNQAKKTAQKIIFRTHDLGQPLDNLTRAGYYPKV